MSAVVIVTGASRGIGHALATILVKDMNARVVVKCANCLIRVDMLLLLLLG